MKSSNYFRWSVLLVYLFTAVLVSANFEAVKDYRFLPCSQSNIARFYTSVVNEQKEVKKQLAKKYADSPKKAAEHPVTLAYGLIVNSARDLKARSEKKELLSSLSQSFSRLQRLHYSVKADLDPYADPSLMVLAVKCGSNYLFGPLKLKTVKPKLDKPIGIRQAMLEARNLYQPGQKDPVGPDKLALMTPLEISRLEPAADHAAIRPVKPGNHFHKFVKDMAGAIRATGGKKSKRFDFSYARRILFFHELKDSASSPKITAKDRYGLKWKVKWGDEVHSDVVATRLAIDLGATYADLKFYSGPRETLLILPPGKDRPTTQHELADMLKKSSYKFHLKRYVVEEPSLKGNDGILAGTGRVDEAMLERESLDRKYLDCYYLAFKECQLTIDNPALKRLGGVDLNRSSAVDDRVARGLVVFSAWIANPDVKEDNTRSGLVWNRKSGDFDRQVEFVSDMGAAFAGPYSAGCLSTLPATVVGEIFNIRLFKTHPVFLPNSWKHCTWADARWMARRIATLSRADIERVFFESGWPDFSQKLGVEKMLARRNDLVKAFDLADEGFKPIPCNPRLTIRFKSRMGYDIPVIGGVINPFSKLVRQAEKAAHPEGLLLSRPRQLD